MVKYIFILMFCAGSLKADSTNIKRSGVNFAFSKSFEIAAFGIGTAAVFAKDQQNAKSLLMFAGVCQIASITYFYKGCQFLIKANGITVRF